MCIYYYLPDYGLDGESNRLALSLIDWPVFAPVVSISSRVRLQEWSPCWAELQLLAWGPSPLPSPSCLWAPGQGGLTLLPDLERSHWLKPRPSWGPRAGRVADRVLVLQLGVRPEPLRWESLDQDIGPPETSWPHLISLGESSPRDLRLSAKTQLHQTTSKFQCWTPHAKQLARQEHNPTH